MGGKCQYNWPELCSHILYEHLNNVDDQIITVYRYFQHLISNYFGANKGMVNYDRSLQSTLCVSMIMHDTVTLLLMYMYGYLHTKCTKYVF